jgi:hypothetical protein
MAVLAELLPNSEQVGVEWLRAAVPYLEGNVATELPAERGAWAAKGFVVVTVVGGSTDIDTGMRHPALSLKAYAVSESSKRPPRYKAAQLLEQIREAIVSGQDTRLPSRLVVIPRAAYLNAKVSTATILSEPRQITDDVADYAVYDMDISLYWVPVPK